MNAKLGRVSAQLAETIPEVSDELADLVNDNVNPPTPVKPGDIFVRTMLVVSDEVNSLGGRFPADEHARLAELLVDSPVLVGHRKDKLPLGRTFHAVIERRGDRQWVKTYFYWLRSAAGADNLLRNIDGGIFKECSIGFTYCFAECSICGRDIRTCAHEPFQQYEVAGETGTCHFNYRKIDRVLETSLVYRGATPHTQVSRDLADSPDRGNQPDRRDNAPVYVASLADLPKGDRYLIVPRYDGIDATLDPKENEVRSESIDGTSLSYALPSETDPIPEHGGALAIRLVGYRGKQRCSRRELESHLCDKRSAVSRVIPFIVPSNEAQAEALKPLLSPTSLRMIPHRFCSAEDLVRSVTEITTQSGVEIGLPDSSGTYDIRYHFNEHDTQHPVDHSYSLSIPVGSTHALLNLHLPSHSATYSVRQFHPGRLQRGARFVSDPGAPDDARTAGVRKWSGRIIRSRRVNGGWVLALRGDLEGVFLLHPARLDESDRFLFYRTRSGSQTETT
jgi:hypothetical protein